MGDAGVPLRRDAASPGRTIVKGYVLRPIKIVIMFTIIIIIIIIICDNSNYYVHV